MMRKKNTIHQNHSFNRLSKWKYLILGLMLACLTLQAIPSFYGDVPAIGINNSLISKQEISHLLEKSKINPISIINENGEHILTFENISDQQNAKKLLEDLNGLTDVTIQYHSAAPKWFKNIGADPVKLGLDLRGGVQLLLFVDLEPVFDRHLNSITEEIRKTLRENKIRNVSIRKVNEKTISIVSKHNIQSFLEENLPPSWRITKAKKHDQLLISILDEEASRITHSAMEQNISTLRDRINELGIVEASVKRQGTDHIRIELPGLYDPKQAKSVIGATASLSFYKHSQHGSLIVKNKDNSPITLEKKEILSGEYIVDAHSTLDEMGRPQVAIKLNNSGGDKLTEFSRKNIGQSMATVYVEYITDFEGKLIPKETVINVATIQSVLGNSFRITGLDNASEANELALLLRSGALTAPIKIVEERAIGPTLGEKNIQAGLSALLIGLLGMSIFLILWYRRFGWIAIVGLIANLIMQIGLLVLLPGAVLTLPGIAGLVLTVGMAVDTNVLIFERIRDRLREGASLASSIDFGYRAAFVTIFDANITTLISALCLYGIGSGPLQGFATTLILGLISSMICGIWITRALINPIWGRDKRQYINI